MSRTPLVSIALPVLNGERTLANAIMSVLSQVYVNWELIIIDDGSEDDTLTVVKKFNDARIKLISDGENKGIAARLNQAMEVCQGKYFARMDADDISFPTRIEAQVRYMGNKPDVDLLGTGVLIFHGNGIPKGILPVRQSHAEICQSPWKGFYLSHPTWLGKTEWFLKHRYRSPADKAEDQDLLFRTYKFSHFACLPEVHLGYREEERSLAKMFTARYTLLKSFSREAMLRRDYLVAAKILYFQYMKAVGDVLNIKFGFKTLRNKVLAPPPALLGEWDKIWHMTKQQGPH